MRTNLELDRIYVMKLGRIVDEIGPSLWKNAMQDDRLAKAYLGA